ncbi:DUF6082 family protein [Paractinoplanes durhamensis]|uniref:DUF6082 family protein n=1 Tax=Paractinoplanes durhamensis TaxID=113563 RepID=UPI001943DC05|nr:DUF6082 family protein [Actinoplanes durhamensis]
MLITASPVLMLLAVQLPLPWNQLGDAGQAYGATSAVLSGLALLGVAVSLVIQQRQHRMTEEQTVRQRHFDLVRLTLDNMKFLNSWGFVPQVDYDPALIGFSNLVLTYWLMLFRIGHMDEEMLRTNARGFFAGQVGRDHWRQDGESWPAIGERDKKFVEILNEEYHRAMESGPATVVPPKHHATEIDRRLPAGARQALVYGAVIGTAVGGYLAGRSRRRN